MDCHSVERVTSINMESAIKCILTSTEHVILTEKARNTQGILLRKRSALEPTTCEGHSKMSGYELCSFGPRYWGVNWCLGVNFPCTRSAESDWRLITCR
jgi:hypothetical protein